jgi:hypothetical protein
LNSLRNKILALNWKKLVVALASVFIFANFCAAASISLPGEVAPDGVVKFTEGELESWQTNDELLTSLFRETLIYRVITIAKYILGAIFMLFLGIYILNFLTAGDKEEASKKFKDQVLWAFVGFAILGVAQPFSEAFMLLRNDKVNLLSDPAAVLASAEIVGFTFRAAAHFIQYVLGAVALVVIGVAGFKMVGSVGDEESVTAARKSIVWSAIGLIVVGGSALFVDNVFAPVDSVEVVAAGLAPAEEQSFILELGQVNARALVLNYVKYFQTFIGALAIFMLFLSGFKMISAAGNEEVATKQRKMITWVFIGLVIILIAEVFVNIFLPDKGGTIIFNSSTAISSFSAQMGGFTNFLLTFLGGISVLALIVGAVYFTSAVANPEQAEKGKKIMLAAALGIIVAVSAFALVSTVLSGDADGTDNSIYLDL